MSLFRFANDLRILIPQIHKLVVLTSLLPGILSIRCGGGALLYLLAASTRWLAGAEAAQRLLDALNADLSSDLLQSFVRDWCCCDQTQFTLKPLTFDPPPIGQGSKKRIAELQEQLLALHCECDALQVCSMFLFLRRGLKNLKMCVCVCDWGSSCLY